jgi:DNA primase
MSAIDEVKQRLDIVQVVSEYVKLQKSGKNYKSACPFHSEKNPSFFVFPDRQSWHCFGACGTGGDIFSFIMKKEGVDFAQALRILANKAGVPLVDQATPQRQAQNKERERLFEINETVAGYYHHILLSASAADAARNYVNGRGVSPETIKDFQVGFAPEGWETIKQYLKGKGYDETESLAAGLLVQRDDGSNYDRFRNRLMFPIRNIQGQVTGFGGRALDDSLPKYLNSPQTLVFDKSGSLYGIDRAKTAIHQKDLAIITEGYMDALAAHQHGYRNVVASMGTAMTDKQLAILKGLTRNLILALDADAAGEEAISRSGEMVDQMLSVPLNDYSSYGYNPMMFDYAQNFEVKVFVLPQGQDLDEVIRENASRWQELIKNAKPMFDFIFEKVAQKFDLSTDTGKSLAVEKLLPLLYQMKEPIRQGYYVERLVNLLKIDLNVLEAALNRFKVAQRKRKTYKDLRGVTPSVLNFTSSKPLEQYCLALLLQYPELRSECTELSLDHFENTENRELFDRWQHCDVIAELIDSLDSTLQEYVNNLMSRAFPVIIKESESIRRKTVEECVIRLQERRLRNLESQREELLAIEAEIGGTAAQLAKLDEQGLEITKKLQEIFVKQNQQHRPAKSDT